ncbi:polysaccharide deacetylase family protein [Candidatus Nitrososphaera evergladensis]|uniref:polysaccharide deacetylase family protein n=1 Tax=Candidatus Nitrososphaera evergladensis TaxID=1459637 RepID=UPI0011E5D3B8|nr:polysaccharide deacetylase family protein [Candidatus Nitrososphaera evergladensis]
MSVILASIIIITASVFLVPAAESARAASTECNCVIFRLDDVQDSWIHDVQAKVLDAFISSDTKLTPGIIMNFYGSDSVVVDKISQGKDAGLFELALHGWNHVDYAQLSLAEQEQTLADANTKLQKINGQKSNIFITPYNSADADTLAAMKDTGLTILSADLYADGSPPFLAVTYPAADPSGIVSIPYTVYYVDEDKPSGQNAKTADQLYAEINDSIEAHGYAVVMLHPPDFAKHDDNNGQALNAVNQSQINTLQTLIDKIKADGKTITSYNELVSMTDNSDQSADAPSTSISNVSLHSGSAGASGSRQLMNTPSSTDPISGPNTIKPQIKITSLTAIPSVTEGSKVKVSGTASDDIAISKVEVRATLPDGSAGTTYVSAALTGDGEEWSFDLPLADPAFTKVVARATDASGNQQWAVVSLPTA